MANPRARRSLSRVVGSLIFAAGFFLAGVLVGLLFVPGIDQLLLVFLFSCLVALAFGWIAGYPLPDEPRAGAGDDLVLSDDEAAENQTRDDTRDEHQDASV